MELEWNPLSKPKPGYESEFLRLFKVMRSLRAIDPNAVDREALDRRWSEIQVTPYETLEAPRVGVDASADEWVVARYQDCQHPTQTEVEFVREMQGFYVLPLVPACDGLPAFSNGGVGHSELFSFRAQLLRDCKEIIGRDALQQSYRSCLAPALEALGDDLRALAAQYAGKTNITQVENESHADFEDGSVAQKVHIVLSAAKWCSYWSHRGHGLAAHWLSEPA